MAMSGRYRSAAAMGSVLAAVGLVAGGCGGGGSPLSSATTGSPATAAKGTQPPATSPATQPPGTQAPTTTTTAAPTTTVTSGGATPSKTDPYGKTAGGVPLPPPNTDDVNSTLVKSAPTLGPFAISASAGPKGWPDACTLTSAAQMHGLDPQVTGYAGTPNGTKATILETGGKSPNNTLCQFNLKTTFQPADEGNLHSYVEVQLSEIDSLAASVWRESKNEQAKEQRKYPAQYALYRLPGGATCYYDGNQLNCLKGDIAYAVLGEKVTADDVGGADSIHWLNEAVIPLAEKLSEELVPKP